MSRENVSKKTHFPLLNSIFSDLLYVIYILIHCVNKNVMEEGLKFLSMGMYVNFWYRKVPKFFIMGEFLPWVIRGQPFWLDLKSLWQNQLEVLV